jgi:hypothetical protein
MRPVFSSNPSSTKLTRNDRARQRALQEELAAWVLVPMFLMCGYWAVQAVTTHANATASLEKPTILARLR